MIFKNQINILEKRRSKFEPDYSSKILKSRRKKLWRKTAEINDALDGKRHELKRQ